MYIIQIKPLLVYPPLIINAKSELHARKNAGRRAPKAFSTFFSHILVLFLSLSLLFLVCLSL